jgi:hypothetical protein
MKKIIFFALILIQTLGSFAYNGITKFTIPISLQSSPFNINGCQIELDNTGKVIFASKGAGLIIFDGNTYTNFNTSNSTINSNFIKDVAVDASNNYYAVSDSGMSVYNGLAWTNYSPANSSIISKALKCIYINNNVIYVGGYSGFSIYNNGLFTNFSKANSGLISDTINDFCLDSNNNLWIGTAKGLCKKSGNTFTAFTTSMTNNITAVIANGNDIWFIEDNGFNLLQRLRNNLIAELSEILDTPVPISPYGTMCKGPNAGILITSNSVLYEILENRAESYLLSAGAPFPPSTIVYNASTNTAWFYGVNKIFHSFQFNNYQNTFAGASPNLPVIFDNCKNIDINQVKAAILNLGDMFWNTKTVKCEIPKNSRKHTVFANSLWIGGIDASNNLRVAAQTYRQSGTDFWPGPLDTITGGTDSAKGGQYNKIWKVSRFDIEQFKYNFLIGNVQSGAFIPKHDILTWPTRDTGNYSRKLAPFVDVNQDGIYNPLSGGDYPLIKGDQMLFWIYNDNLGIHTESKGLPMKVEIHASAYAFACPTLSTRDSILNYTTFYNYKIFNRSGQIYDSCLLANWTDYDIGNPNNDLYGTNQGNNFVYSYNRDSIDDANGENKYGLNPPIMSCVILNGPLAYTNDGIDNNNDGTTDESGEKNGMTNSIYYENSFTLTGNPANASDYFGYLKTRWKDNTPLTYGGNGHGGTVPQKYIFPDFPYVANAWAQTSATDGRMVQGCGPFRFIPNVPIEYDYAFVFSRDTNLAYKSAAYFNMAVSDVQRVKSWFDNNNAPSCLAIFPGISEQSTQLHQLLLFPNPGNNSIQLQFSDQSEITNFVVYDIMGRQLISSDLQTQEKLIVHIDISKLISGVFFITTRNKNGRLFHSKFIKE